MQLLDTSELTGVAVEIAQGATRYAPLVQVVLDTRQARHAVVVDSSGQRTAVGHFHQMPKQTKTGDIGHGGHAVELAEAAPRLVQGAHPVASQAHVTVAQLALFLCGGEDTDPQRLGQVQQATGGGGVVALHVAFFHQPGDGQAEDRLRCVNRMTARQWNTRLVTHRTASANHFPGNLRRQHVDWPAKDGNRHQRVTAHGVDVADGIGGGDATEIERVIDNRHEKVGGRDHTLLVIDGVHRRVIARSVAHPEFRVEVLRAAAGQNHLQHLGRNLAATTCAMAVLGQANRLAHEGTSAIEDERF
ncbi:hypothetical protein D3C85_542570 [compost metagenome]